MIEKVNLIWLVAAKLQKIWQTRQK